MTRRTTRPAEATGGAAGDTRTSAPNAHALVLTGGPHPFAQTTPRLVDLLAETGVASTVVADPDAAAAHVATAGPGTLLVLNTLRWRMRADRYAPQRDAHAYATSPALRRTFAAHVAGGGALLALHAAPICFDDWPGWRDVVGAAWDWDRSRHPPLGEVHVRVRGPHPLVDGIDDFTIQDEAYGFMDLADDVEALATARHGDADHPLLWARRVGAGRVVTST
ncbi:MAG TPA: ThuA domain-containing protein, partial [Acidimicrobiales bacterium]|nr:ThuA domain-containing protein [Acidimicrobiales bacterium]